MVYMHIHMLPKKYREALLWLVTSPFSLTYTFLPRLCVWLCVQYERGRELADFVKFLNDKCGTNRLPGGKLSPEVLYLMCMHFVCMLHTEMI